MIGWLNVGSFVLGLIAWAIPLGLIFWTMIVKNVGTVRKEAYRDCILFIFLSMGLCGVSLLLQLFNVYNRVQLGDWSALTDIEPTRVMVATILLGGTVGLNGLVVIVYRQA